MNVFLRRAAPLLLLVLAGLVLFEEYLPGHETFQRYFGRDAVVRFVVALLCLYVLLLMAARYQMEASFRELVSALRHFRQTSGSGQPDPKAQREAMHVLVATLAGGSAEVKRSSHEHLCRLSGQDFGNDADAWRAWVDAHHP